MTRPTQSELIERIEQCYLGDDVPNRVYELLHDILCHLADPWIPVEERLPEVKQWCLFIANDEVDLGYVLVVNGERRFMSFTSHRWIRNVTHWCPLPPLPKKGESL